MTARTAFGVLALCVLLGACGERSGAASPDPALEVALARADHAARCLQLTTAIAALPPGLLRERAEELDLARITPQLASRWVPVWNRAAQNAKLSTQDAASTLRGSAVAMIDTRLLDTLTDEAFECGSEADMPLHG